MSTTDVTYDAAAAAKARQRLAIAGTAVRDAREAFVDACANDFASVGDTYFHWLAAVVEADHARDEVAATQPEGFAPPSRPSGATVPAFVDALSWGMQQAVLRAVAETEE